ncbi:hypothetical protein HPB50_025232 [Hyalomma asiaticum]|uniref:Uncharacterized protein n=1 Tax=Hyalomma asiaticum TaxID=266040 RepID=A0ACB7S8M8_HYAAI|nr:hypothetical protein HPB50_025232 [Hyalomma asiaticum]
MPDTYGSFYLRHSHSALLNMAVMGQLLAEALWYVTLFQTVWSPTTMANIKRFQACFVMAYLNDIDPTNRDQVISHALGVESVLHGFERPHLHDVRIAWRMWRISFTILPHPGY